ncbi:hypothetical protein INT46_008890 [Mucor plumbeus]|uniref:F-box domain-containing protein n=1 Tax=Mucor plumbeus TaxID=97098 RepID=A0A8H7QH95_9FUNG|nr:hypothetical protein INT46_008890 [Mucor plumbeus]
MADWTYLPYEVLNHVFGYLPSSKYVHKCLFVCKNWHQPAKYCLFKHLYFGNEEQIHQYLAAIDRMKNYNFELVAESIDIRRLYYRPTFSAIIRLLEICSNLKSIAHNGDPERYRLIKLMHTRHKLKKLQLIAAPERYSMKDYIACAIQLREQLSRLDLIEIANWLFSTHIFTTLYDQLDQFIKLEYLYLEKATELYEIDKVIDNCVSVKTLELKLFKSPSLREFGFDVHEEAEENNENSNAIDYSKLTPRPNIQIAKFKLHSLSSKSIEYLVFKFPKLQSLDLAPHKNGLTRTTKSVPISTSIMLNILLFLCKIRHVDMSFTFEVNDALDAIAKFLVIAKFNGNVEISCHLVAKTSYRLDNPLISYSSESSLKKLKLQYFRAIIQENAPLRGPTIMPHLTLIEVVGSYIKKLVLGGLDNKFVNGTANAYYLIDYTLTRCPFLVHMGFVCCSLAYYPLQIFTTPHIFMESLSFDNCDLNCQAFIKLSLVLPRLKSIVMKDCRFSSYQTKRQKNGSTRRWIILRFPFTNFEQFCFQNIQQYQPLSKIYLKLIVDSRQTYAVYSKNQKGFSTISQKAFYAPKIESDSLHIDFLCKSLKKFKMS